MADLQFILDKTTGDFKLWACRGEGKGCDRNKYRKQKVHCEDCYGPCPEDITLAELKAILDRGDA
jgi:hypothetical protein